MKKILYRLSSSGSFARLFSIFAVAVVAFAVTTDAQAQRTRTGGASGTGSYWELSIRLFDEETTISSPQNGFFAVSAPSRDGDFIACKWDPDGNPAPAVDKLCTASTDCTGFKAGTCSAKGKNTTGQRTSTITCPTGGCTGTLSVFNLDGTGPIEVINIGGDADVSSFNRTACNNAFPASGNLARGQIGQITTVCSKSGFDPNEPVLSQNVRGPIVNGEI